MDPDEPTETEYARPLFGLCARIKCGEAAEFYPVLLLRPKGYEGEPVRALVKLPVCAVHAKKDIELPEVYLPEPGWKAILGGFDSMKRVRPHRAATRLEFVDIAIDGDDASQFWATLTPETRH